MRNDLPYDPVRDFAPVSLVVRNTTVLVRADEDSQFKKVTEVWDLCRQLGLNQVKMQARK